MTSREKAQQILDAAWAAGGTPREIGDRREAALAAESDDVRHAAWDIHKDMMIAVRKRFEAERSEPTDPPDTSK